ncbi:MAG: 30S ribosomal protein S2 [Candidatus Omnitrophota bacterium]
MVATQMIRELLENGVHFGHQTNKWHPKMGKFIFGEKNKIYIIDLKKTEEALIKAMDFVRNLTSEGKKVLFVGTKKQSKKIIKQAAQKSGMFYVDERWLGGCLTNFDTIRKSVERLRYIQQIKEGGTYNEYAKKEKARIDKEEYKLLKNLGGIVEMTKLPDAVVVADAEIGDIAIKEARKVGVPVVALVDTNCDPNMVDYPIPGNDDAIRSIEYIISKIAEAAEEGVKESVTGKKVKDMKNPEQKPEDMPAENVTEPAPAEKPKAEEKQETPASAEETPVEEKVEKKVAPAEEKPAQEQEDAPEGDIKLDM